MTNSESLPSDAELFAELGRQIVLAPGVSQLDRLTHVAVQRVPGAQEGGIIRGSGSEYLTTAPTSAAVSTLDEIQCDCGSGPLPGRHHRRHRLPCR